MKISIITITYNSEKTLEETILSVINQKNVDLEYIIVDGQSTDQTMSIVNKYRDHIAKVISEPDNGISDAFNKGIGLATGDIVGIINSDDMLTQHALEMVQNVVEQNPGVDVFYGNSIRFRDDRENYIYKPDNDLHDLLHFMFLSHPSTFVRRSAYIKYGVFEEKYRMAMDFRLLSKMYREGAAFRYIDAELTWFRLDGTSMKKEEITRAESVEIAVMNGIDERQARAFYQRVYRKGRIIALLERLGVGDLLRRRIKKQNKAQTPRKWYLTLSVDLDQKQ